tara:strand:- start:1723 stop:1938 length:216 start_codon:yes stop_codon:yes gene_type:complete
MSTNDKKEMFKFAIKINLFIGLYNLFLFSFSGMYINLVVGAMNLGVFIFFRDVKIVEALNQYISKKNTNYN